MILSARKIFEGYKVPWYYGLAYRDFLEAAAYFYVVPINFIVRFAMWMKYRYDKMRFGMSWIDTMMNDERVRSYDEGVKQGEFNARIRLEDSIKDILKREYHHGVVDGARNALNEIREHFSVRVAQ